MSSGPYLANPLMVAARAMRDQAEKQKQYAFEKWRQWFDDENAHVNPVKPENQSTGQSFWDWLS